MQYFLQYLLSCSTTRHPQCCSLGKPRGLCVRLSVHCFHQLLFSENCFEVVPTDDRSCSWLQHLCPRPVSKLPTLKLSWRGHTLIHFNGCQHLLCQRTSLSDSKKMDPATKAPKRSKSSCSIRWAKILLHRQSGIRTIRREGLPSTLVYGPVVLL